MRARFILTDILYSFAYVFFSTSEEQAKAIAKSEQELEGRALLIKAEDNFERADGIKPPTEKEKKEIKKQKNPPCPTLFLGNLSFEATEQSIREAFEWAGDIRKVRVATFEDSGKCKGYVLVKRKGAFLTNVPLDLHMWIILQ